MILHLHKTRLEKDGNESQPDGLASPLLPWLQHGLDIQSPLVPIDRSTVVPLANAPQLTHGHGMGIYPFHCSLLLEPYISMPIRPGCQFSQRESPLHLQSPIVSRPVHRDTVSQTVIFSLDLRSSIESSTHFLPSYDMRAVAGSKCRL